MAGRRLAALVLSEAERAELGSLAARRNTAQALALRARIVLGCAAGEQNKVVAARLRVAATCTALKPFAGGGPCRVMAAAPGEWGLRVVERRERGAPLHELVCVGDPADCPSGSTCSPRHYCR